MTTKNKKKTLLLSILVIVVAILGFVTYKFLNATEKADIVIYGNIYTGTEGERTEQALAIKGDRFIYVGDADGVKPYISEKTEIIQQKDGLVLPGFTDTHTHVTPSFGVVKYQIDLSKATSVEEYSKIIEDFVKAHPNEEMYMGRGWNYMLFKDGVPTKEILDHILPDKPIFIKSNDGHACWINSKMIELIGVTKGTKDPIGGEVVKDANGNPVGCFRDVAMDLYVKPHLIPYSVDQYKELIQEAQMFYAELGYTSYVEVFVEADNTNINLFKAYEELDKEGKLKLRVQGAWNVSNDEKAIDKVTQLIKYKDESKGGMFELTDIKIFMDGVAETGTAYFSEPYANDKTNYGADRWPSDEDFKRLVDCVVLANKNNMVVHFHAIGDAAITKALDAIEAARKEVTNENIHNVITHLETVKDRDIKRIADLDVVVAANFTWGSMDAILYPTVEVKYLGAERAFKAYPYKSVLDAGAVVSGATDYPAGAVPSPIAAYIVAVTRNSTDDPNMVRDPSQRMTVDEALRALTYGGAYQMRQEKYRGTIEVGKKADLIIVDTNLLKSHSVKTMEAKVLLNMVNGKIIYKA